MNLLTTLQLILNTDHGSTHSRGVRGWRSLPSLHPSIDNGLTKGDPNFAGGKLKCHCSSNPVEVKLDSQVAHNHACGCSMKERRAVVASDEK